MAKLDKMVSDVTAKIDTSKVMIDKVLSSVNVITDALMRGDRLSYNPIYLIMWLLNHLGVSYEELKEFLTNFLIVTLPAVELGVKGALLTNLKSTVSCSSDPRIPFKFRKQYKSPQDAYGNEYGIDIDIESIDFLDKLSVSPLKEGKDLYFGTENIENVYKFARADDFDAFLWFVIHKGKFPMPANVTNWASFGDSVHGAGASNVTPSESKASLFSEVTVEFNNNTKSKILVGNTFTYSGTPNVIGMCINTETDSENNIVKNTIVPVSDDRFSVNWYIRRKDQFGKNLVAKNEPDYEKRDYSKERAICNLQYIDQASSSSPVTGLVNNKIRFTILPKPLVHMPNLSNNEAPWNFKKLLFDSSGSYDINGKCSISGSDSTETSYADGAITIDGNKVVTNGDVRNKLRECYPGLTIYEFNYDYVMGMRLFDPKVIINTLFNSAVNVKIGAPLKFSKRRLEAEAAVIEIVRKVIESEDSSISDCFFTFDNTKYDEMLKKAEAKRAKMQPFGDATLQGGDFSEAIDILSEFDTNADINVQKETLNRAIDSISKNFSQGSEAKNQYQIQLNLVSYFVENLVNTLVLSILSPKILMLFEVNRQIMGDLREKPSFEDILKSMSAVITSIAREIRDMIVQALYGLLLEKLDSIVKVIDSLLIRESLDDYTDIIRDILRHASNIMSMIGGSGRYEDTPLDNVDYPDIDMTETITEDQPKISC